MGDKDETLDWTSIKGGPLPQILYPKRIGPVVFGRKIYT